MVSWKYVPNEETVCLNFISSYSVLIFELDIPKTNWVVPRNEGQSGNTKHVYLSGLIGLGSIFNWNLLGFNLQSIYYMRITFIWKRYKLLII